MKVKIGKYPTWWGPYQCAELLTYLGFSKETCEKIGDKLPAAPFQWFHDKFKNRNVKVHIDRYDVWSMDYTLALIVLPMLKILKEDKMGAPYTDDADVPEHLRSTACDPKLNDWDTDENHFKRWEYILDEMIFAFESYFNDWEEKFQSGIIDHQFVDNADGTTTIERGPKHTFEVDWEERRKYQERINKGFLLFGKYYTSLWD